MRGFMMQRYKDKFTYFGKGAESTANKILYGIIDKETKNNGAVLKRSIHHSYYVSQLAEAIKKATKYCEYKELSDDEKNQFRDAIARQLHKHSSPNFFNS